MSELQTTPDSSKDLEKDEREWTAVGEAELSIAREALEKIEQTGEGEYQALDASIMADIAIAALARLQAKEEGT